MIWLRGYLNRTLIRIFDIIFSLTGLILLSPLIVLLSLIILIDSPGTIFFTQMRVGKNNTDFKLLKFRTMRKDSERLGLITVGVKDTRVTRFGSFLRRFKLDELPQLINVLKGQMCLVGPRPEVRKYTQYYSPAEQMIVLSIKPGITDLASINYSKESELLSDSSDPEKYYIEVIMPAKIKLNLDFIENHTFGNYICIIFRTIGKLIRH
jgi:lipopolysaccharide/colanic/teichoic acid biosynthesis glycosyltransferase